MLAVKVLAFDTGGTPMCLRPGRRPTDILNPMDQGAHSSKPRHCLLSAAHVPLPIETGYLKRVGRRTGPAQGSITRSPITGTTRP